MGFYLVYPVENTTRFMRATVNHIRAFLKIFDGSLAIDLPINIRNKVFVDTLSGIYRLNLSKYLLAVKSPFAEDQT